KLQNISHREDFNQSKENNRSDAADHDLMKLAKVLVSQLSTVCESAWILGLHQTFLLLLIIGRWLLPIGGEITRDQLSQLLLMFVGTAADILEFTSETLEIKDISTLIIQSTSDLISLLTVQHIGCKTSESSMRILNLLLCKHSADLWNIGISVFIQDGPFFVVRLILMSYYGVINQTLVFFTAKNILILILQLYRLTVLLLDFRTSLQDQSNSWKGGVNCCPGEPEDTSPPHSDDATDMGEHTAIALDDSSIPTDCQ
uniref:Transmembrane protein 26 n=1 Tax=Crocodylus porosus TaxID=8502 RepID=A0A7M4ETT7_CROPO